MLLKRDLKEHRSNDVLHLDNLYKGLGGLVKSRDYLAWTSQLPIFITDNLPSAKILSDRSQTFDHKRKSPQFTTKFHGNRENCFPNKAQRYMVSCRILYKRSLPVAGSYISWMKEPPERTK